MAEFSVWLNGKLRELNTDESVFGSYIIGILEGDETYEEKTEALEGLLSEINVDQDVVSEIFKKWLECNPNSNPNSSKEPTKSLDLNEELAKLLEAQKLEMPTRERQLTDEEKRIKEQILAQYSQTEVSDEDAYDDDDDDVADKQTTGNSMGGIERNTNKQDVMQLQKERREQARLDSAAKKQKDKEDREKQKQQREEKKEKRKTSKNEKRR